MNESLDSGVKTSPLLDYSTTVTEYGPGKEASSSKAGKFLPWGGLVGNKIPSQVEGNDKVWRFPLRTIVCSKKKIHA